MFLNLYTVIERYWTRVLVYFLFRLFCGTSHEGYPRTPLFFHGPACPAGPVKLNTPLIIFQRLQTIFFLNMPIIFISLPIKINHIAVDFACFHIMQYMLNKRSHVCGLYSTSTKFSWWQITIVIHCPFLRNPTWQCEPLKIPSSLIGIIKRTLGLSFYHILPTNQFQLNLETNHDFTEIRSTHQCSRPSPQHSMGLRVLEKRVRFPASVQLRFKLFGFPSMETGVDRLYWNRSGADRVFSINMIHPLPLIVNIIKHY